MILVSNLVKRYGQVSAVDGITFDVTAGEIFGLLGHNRAGKTTIRMLTGRAKPTSGTATIASYGVATEFPLVKPLINLVVEEPNL